MKKDLIFEVENPSRLLEFLYNAVKTLPRGKVKSCLEHRQVFVNGVVTTKFDHALSPGDTVRVSAAEGSRRTHGIEIIYEDEHFVAVNKPAKLLTVATDGEKQRTAYALLSENRRGELFVVHRLDRDTS
ncbi:MAG: RluA family pseudouridine synthase, partial [Oscillospiraceae bacterium]|nr:RluA family pseudouridine synthase [Oscillospiraceae bacterium]